MIAIATIIDRNHWVHFVQLLITKIMDLNFKNITITAIVSALLIGLAAWAFPTYGVWTKAQRGKADLAEASFNRQIQVQEAEAKLDSAEKLGQAEVVRAQKLAEAVDTLGTSLKINPEYLQYLWIQEVQAGQSAGDTSVIYLPGEAFTPFAKQLETGRVAQQAQPPVAQPAQ